MARAYLKRTSQEGDGEDKQDTNEARWRDYCSDCKHLITWNERLIVNSSKQRERMDAAGQRWQHWFYVAFGIPEFCGFLCKPDLQRNLTNAAVLTEDLSRLLVRFCSSVPCSLIDTNVVTLSLWRAAKVGCTSCRLTPKRLLKSQHSSSHSEIHPNAASGPTWKNPKGSIMVRILHDIRKLCGKRPVSWWLHTWSQDLH